MKLGYESSFGFSHPALVLEKRDNLNLCPISKVLSDLDLEEELGLFSCPLTHSIEANFKSRDEGSRANDQRNGTAFPYVHRGGSGLNMREGIRPRPANSSLRLSFANSNNKTLFTAEEKAEEKLHPIAVEIGDCD